MTRRISEGRKRIYYAGMALSIIGGLSFASTFVLFTTQMFIGPDFDASLKLGALSFVLGAAGIMLLIVGTCMRKIGAEGLAGSGAVLDPEQAREELEPWARMKGGLIKDALDEADIHIGGAAQKVVMVKCPSCGKLNEEDSKFCQECGQQL